MDQQRDPFSGRSIWGLVGFRLFNLGFKATSDVTPAAVFSAIWVVVLTIYGGLLYLTYGFTRVPSGFIPARQGIPAGGREAARLVIVGAHARSNGAD
jgi:hypothetical protein